MRLVVLFTCLALGAEAQSISKMQEDIVLRINGQRLEAWTTGGAYKGWVCEGRIDDWAWSGDPSEPIAVLKQGRVEIWTVGGAYKGWVCDDASGRLRAVGGELIVERRGHLERWSYGGAYRGRVE